MDKTFIIKVETDGSILCYPIKIENTLITETGIYVIQGIKFWVVSNLKED